MTKMQVGPRFRPLEGDSIDFDQFMESYKDVLNWLAGAICKHFERNPLYA